MKRNGSVKNHSARKNGRSYSQVSEACIARLSLYVRELLCLESQHVSFVSSHSLARGLRVTDAQVRRDLSYFGKFGTSGSGYEVHRLRDQLSIILGVSDRAWNVALAGAGNLGSALLAYKGFQERGFIFRLVLDSDIQKIGQSIQDLKVEPTNRLGQLVKAYSIHIGVIAVPVQAAQMVCDQFIDGGVRAIVNFAPIRLQVPSGVWLRTVDLAVELEGLAFHLAQAHR